MKKIIVGLAGLMIILLPSEIAFAFGRGGSFSGSRGNFSSSNRYGGSTSHSYGSTSHSNAYGGSSSHTAGQGTTHNSAYGTSTSHNEGGGTTHTNAYGGKTSGEYGEGATHTNTYGGTTSAQYGQGATHTNVYGGTTSAAYGEGAYHTGAYGYGTAYHPPTAYYGYHPPATVNYYGSTCANCNGWAAAAAVTTAAVTGAAVASANANAANANAAAASANAYNSGYNAGTTTSQPATTTTTVVATARQLFHGAACWSSPGRLHYSHRPRHDLLLVWQYLVQRGLRRKRRLLPRGAWSRRLALRTAQPTRLPLQLWWHACRVRLVRFFPVSRRRRQRVLPSTKPQRGIQTHESGKSGIHCELINAQ